MGKHVSSWLSGFLFGSAIGVGIALLSAPQSGEMTRFMIRERGKQVKDQVRTTIEDGRQRATTLADDVSSQLRYRTSRLKEVGQDVLDEQRQVIQRSARKAKQAIERETRGMAYDVQQIVHETASNIEDTLES